MIRAYESAQTLRGQASDDLHPTLKKVQAFLRLQPGWHYGRGMAFTPELIKEALQFQVYATSLGFYETDAFPGIDGSIMLTVYEGPDSIEFTLNPCGDIDYRRETDDVEVSEREGLTLSAAQGILREFRRETCKPSVSYTTGTLITAKNALLQTHLHLSGAAFLLSMNSVYSHPGEQFASTFASTTPPWQVTPQYSGDSRRI